MQRPLHALRPPDGCAPRCRRCIRRRRCAAAQGEVQQLLQQFAQVVNVWRAMVSHAAVLEYHAAAEVISTSEQLARAFRDQAQRVRPRAVRPRAVRPHACA